jgi:hypothetical protein
MQIFIHDVRDKCREWCAISAMLQRRERVPHDSLAGKRRSAASGMERES